jgi:hypothetical protein
MIAFYRTAVFLMKLASIHPSQEMPEKLQADIASSFG